jgi:hypothetical protein
MKKRTIKAIKLRVAAVTTPTPMSKINESGDPKMKLICEGDFQCQDFEFEIVRTHEDASWALGRDDRWQVPACILLLGNLFKD